MFPVDFDKALDMVERGLDIRVVRQNLIASNIANKDTPGYKARDLDFRSVLEAVESSARSAVGRIDTGQGPCASEIRTPEVTVKDDPARLDGNNVETTEEMRNLVENTLTYDALLRCAAKKLQLMKLAIQGG